MNFAVILDDGTLAFSSAGAPLAAVLDVAAGLGPSILEQAGVSEVDTKVAFGKVATSKK